MNVPARRCPERPHLLDGAAMGQYHCPCCGCMVVAGMEHIHDPDCCTLDDIPEDEYQRELELADRAYARLLDRRVDPNKSLPRLAGDRVWVWMNGPVEPHWAIRGTGLVMPEADA